MRAKLQARTCTASPGKRGLVAVRSHRDRWHRKGRQPGGAEERMETTVPSPSGWLRAPRPQGGAPRLALQQRRLPTQLMTSLLSCPAPRKLEEDVFGEQGQEAGWGSQVQNPGKWAPSAQPRPAGGLRFRLALWEGRGVLSPPKSAVWVSLGNKGRWFGCQVIAQ